MKLVSILIAILLSGCVSTTSRLQEMHEAVIRLQNRQARGYGSGVAISPRRILSAAHLCMDSQSLYSDQFDMQLKVIAADAVSDLCLLQADQDVFTSYATVALDSPTYESVVGMGYRMGHFWVSSPGYLLPDLINRDRPLVLTTVLGGGPGVSGGALFLADTYPLVLAGILVAAIREPDARVIVVPSSTIVKFLTLNRGY